MKSIAALLIAAFVLAASPAMAQDPAGQQRPAPMPESPSSKSKDGFAGMLTVTADADWQAKWETPEDTAPHFTEAREVEDGGRLFVLSFLSNPMLDSAGNANVSCDILVTRPDGSTSTNERQVPCFVRQVRSNPKNVYLTTTTIGFIAEPADPRGLWRVEVTLRDNLRGVELPLETSFTVK